MFGYSTDGYLLVMIVAKEMNDWHAGGLRCRSVGGRAFTNTVNLSERGRKNRKSDAI